MGLANLGSESETCVGSRVHLVGISISFEKNFYQLPFTPPPPLVRRIGPSTSHSKVPNRNLSPRKYISKKLQQLKGWEIKGNKARVMPQQTAPQFLSSATTKGTGERFPYSRLGTRRWVGTLRDPMPAVLPSSAAKRRTLDAPWQRSRRLAHDLNDEASSSDQEEGASSGDAGSQNKLRGDLRPKA
jgi:hypothetical protein